MPHWKSMVDAEYLGVYSLENDKDMVLTIKEVKKKEVVGEGSKKSNKPIAYFIEPVKPMVLNATNCKTISRLYGSSDTATWAGKKIQIYADHKVKAFGDVTEGLRIRAFKPVSAPPKGDKPEPCVDCDNPVVGFGEYTAEQIAHRNNEKYGRVICVECAKKLKAAEQEKEGVDGNAETKE